MLLHRSSQLTPAPQLLLAMPRSHLLLQLLLLADQLFLLLLLLLLMPQPLLLPVHDR